MNVITIYDDLHYTFSHDDSVRNIHIEGAEASLLHLGWKALYTFIQDSMNILHNIQIIHILSYANSLTISQNDC